MCIRDRGHALFNLFEVIAVLVDVELVGDVPVLDNRPRDKLREHDHISAEINDVALG